MRARLPDDDRRADDRQGRGRRAADHLARGSRPSTLSPLEVSDYVNRYIQPRLPALPGAADVRIFGERQVVDAHLARPRPARRLPAHGAGRRGRAAPPERRDAGRPHRDRSAREFTVVAETDLAHARAVRRHHRRATSAATRCASATSARVEIGAGRRARDLALQRQAVAQHRRHQAGDRQPARAVDRRCAPRSPKINEDAARRA